MKREIESLSPKLEYIESIKAARSLIFPEENNLTEWYAKYSNNHLNRLSYDLQYLISEFQSVDGIRVLELGSVPPILTLAMKNKGFIVTGFDVDPSRFDSCITNNNLDIVCGKLGTEKLPFKNNEFDAILMNEVFEHLNSNLITILSDINRVLKPGGKLFISTPNLRSLIGIKNFLLKGKAYSCCGELYEEYEKIEKFGHMGHVREYTPVELTLFLEKLDFKVLKLIYRGKYPIKYRVFDILFPKLKPFFSIISIKK